MECWKVEKLVVRELMLSEPMLRELLLSLVQVKSSIDVTGLVLLYTLNIRSSIVRATLAVVYQSLKRKRKTKEVQYNQEVPYVARVCQA